MSDLISKAHIYCVAKHAFQRRKYSGEPYWIHPIRVAGMIMDVPSCTDSKIITALLHDVIEDTPTTYNDILFLFGEEVANGVLGLTNTSKSIAPNANRATRKELDRQKIQIKPAWIRLIKYCDRWDNLSDTFEYITNWNVKQKLPESGWFYKYIQESQELLKVLNQTELESVYGEAFFEKYNLNMLMDTLRDELDLLNQKVENI